MRLISADAFIAYADEPSIFDTTDLKAMIAEQRTIDAAPIVHGKWISVYMSSPSSFTGTCSACHITNDIPPSHRANYCPNCGAKMDLGREG